MKKQTFESFLQDKFAKGYMGTDDNMPEAFDTWLVGPDVEQTTKYADEYGDQQYDAGKIAGLDRATEILKN